MMINNLYKKLLNIIKRKVIFYFLAVFVLLFIAIPLPTFAFWDKLVAAILAIPVLFIATILKFLIIVSAWAVNLLTDLLGWVISPNFVRMSYTKPCAILPPPPGSDCNPIITIGLQTTQQFVNLLLVVMLVYIAIAIALRLQEGNAKKMFTKLILVALLVNFAPVLIGLVVDAANILMYYFLTPLQGGITQLGSQLAVYGDTYAKSLDKVWSDLPSQAALLGQALTLVTMNMMLEIVLYIFIGLFTVRYVAIWIIVILSPLAFVFYIWPATENLAKQWWKQLLQWSFIGIPIAFFMFLGISSFSALTANFQAAQIQASSATDPITVRLLSDLFPYFIVMIFLIIGIFIGISSSAMGAHAVIKGMGKGAVKIGQWGAAGIGAIAGGLRKGGQNRLKQFQIAQRLSTKGGATKGQAFRSGAAAAAGWTHAKQRRYGRAQAGAASAGRGKLGAAWAGFTAGSGLNRAASATVEKAAYRKARAAGKTDEQAAEIATAAARRKGSPASRLRGTKIRKGARATGKVLYKSSVAATKGVSNAFLWSIKEMYNLQTKKSKKKKKKKS